MAQASIQITQGALVGTAGQSVIGLDATTAIVLTDAGGAGATSWVWEILSFPAPDASAPAVVTSLGGQVGTITPSPSLTDGTYLVRLTRNDPVDGLSTDLRFFAVANDDGHSLPSPGMNGAMTNVSGSAAAQAAGWSGGQAGGSNVFLDAFLRLRKTREGRYFGNLTQTNYVSATPVSLLLTDGVDEPFQQFTVSGTGVLTVELVHPAAESGRTFRFRVAMVAGAGGFAVEDGVGGPTLLSLAAPGSGTTSYEVVCVWLANAWFIQTVQIIDVLTLATSKEIVPLAGLASAGSDTFQRVATFWLDPSTYPANASITFEAVLETTVNTAECRLYNVSDAVEVATLSALSTTPEAPQVVAVTLPAANKLYEIQLRITPAGTSSDRATCSDAKVVLSWG